MMNKLSLLMLLVIVIIVTGCSSETSGTTEAPSSTEAAYPYPANIDPDTLPPDPYPYPSPQSQAIPEYPGISAEPQSLSEYPDPLNTDVYLPPEPPNTAPKPKPGMAAISGALYSYNSEIRIAGTQAYLTLASGENQDELYPVLGGPKPEIGDITFTTDEKGNFELDNIPPGRYFLIVWAPYSWSPVQISETDNAALLFDLKADQEHPLGVLNVSWP